jgi:hypothetical protein
MTVKKITMLMEALIVGRFYIPTRPTEAVPPHPEFREVPEADHPTAPKVPLPRPGLPFHVRKGNTFIPKIEKALPPPFHEQHTNSTLTLVCRSHRKWTWKWT